MADLTKAQIARKTWMSLLAKAADGRIAALLDQHMTRPEFTWLRAPEIGSMMVQGKAGAVGARFNLGETTVTRCSLRLHSGVVGHAYIQGRRKTCAEAAALVDALLQTEAALGVRAHVLTPLKAEQDAARANRAQKAAATKVDFFTMMRGED